MSKFIQRAYPRTLYQVPIQYAASNSNQFHSARMINYSAGGICYETDQQMELDTEITVVMDNYSPDQAGPQGYRSYLTRIRWIQQLSEQLSSHFATGSQIIARSHEVLTGVVGEPRYNCDLCGALMQISRLQCTHGNAHLCEPCHKHFKSIPSGKLRDSVERFLVGNVV